MTKPGIILSLVLALTVIYFLLMPLASNGYGYTGYHGYWGSSIWGNGGAGVYNEPSSRQGSLNGTNRLGGGPGSGK